jgi:hypothetical protein
VALQSSIIHNAPTRLYESFLPRRQYGASVFVSGLVHPGPGTANCFRPTLLPSFYVLRRHCSSLERNTGADGLL